MSRYSPDLNSAFLAVIRITDSRSPTDDTPMIVEKVIV